MEKPTIIWLEDTSQKGCRILKRCLNRINKKGNEKEKYRQSEREKQRMIKAYKIGRGEG